MGQDKKTFFNPKGRWVYMGTFSIEFKDLTAIDKEKILHESEHTIDDSTITFKNSTVVNYIGRVHIVDEKEKCHMWTYKYMKCIRKENDDLLWVNDAHRND